jgi:hypothetical protein
MKDLVPLAVPLEFRTLGERAFDAVRGGGSWPECEEASAVP